MILMKAIKEKYGFKEVIAIGELVNNKKQGRWKFYLGNGMLWREVEFKNGIENGSWKMWHEETGKIYIDQYLIDGKSNGYWREYYENGQIKEEGGYMKGKYSPINFWDENGNQLMKEGTGIKIDRRGISGLAVYHWFYDRGKFVREEQIEGYTILR